MTQRNYSTAQSRADIEHRSAQYAHGDDLDRTLAHAAVRGMLTCALQTIDVEVPPGRYKALALTAIEEACMWANKGIAAHVDPPAAGPPSQIALTETAACAPVKAVAISVRGSVQDFAQAVDRAAVDAMNAQQSMIPRL